MTWPGPITAITLFVEDLAATKQFYLDVFALPVVYEDDNSAVFKFGEILINLLKVDRACPGGWPRRGSPHAIHPLGR
jgi:catechol 2,3-dioxygenase-like lactoylglutathione lyase family enzyme